MRQPVEQRRRHLRVAKDARPFAERHIGRDDRRGLLVEAADQVEQQLPARLREWQVTQPVQHHEIHPALAARAPLRLQPVH